MARFNEVIPPAPGKTVFRPTTRRESDSNDAALDKLFPLMQELVRMLGEALGASGSTGVAPKTKATSEMESQRRVATRYNLEPLAPPPPIIR